MSISNKVTKSFKDFLNKEYEEALFQICPAIDATIKKEGYRGKNSEKYKKFLGDNIEIITDFMFGTRLSGLSIGGYSHPGLPTNTEGSNSIEEIIYHIIRCGLIHEVKLPENMQITENTIGTNLIPKNLILGLIMCVVLSPENSNERTEPGFHIKTKKGVKLYLNDYWGQRDKQMIFND